VAVAAYDGPTGAFRVTDGRYQGQADDGDAKYVFVRERSLSGQKVTKQSAAYLGESGGGVFTADGCYCGAVYGFEPQTGVSRVVAQPVTTRFLETCLRWFRRPNVTVNANSPTQAAQALPVAPDPPSVVVTAPAAAAPTATPFDPTSILQRLSALEAIQPQIMSTLQGHANALAQHSAALASQGAQLAKGLNFATSQPGGGMSAPVNKQLGDTVTIQPFSEPVSTSVPPPPTPISPVK
jgi:hypothetical protein